MPITSLKEFAADHGITLAPQREIADDARDVITSRYNYSTEQIKEHFDALLRETEREAYRIYLEHQEAYGRAAITAFAETLLAERGNASHSEVASLIGEQFLLLDRFFLSIAQSRKQRAGKSFEQIHNSLFRALGYPFDEQQVINGKPDFLMPSRAHYNINPMDCIIFTAKRTLRERWRQIVTEGTRGLGFYLATIDDSISSNQLSEMLAHRIYIVCPEEIKQSNPVYSQHVNVLSFRQFFRDHLDPKMNSWRQNNVV